MPGATCSSASLSFPLESVLYPSVSMGKVPYLPVQPHKCGVACCNTTGDLQNVLMTVLHLGQGGDCERHTSVKLGVQIQMAEMYFLPRFITKKTEK